MSARSRFFSKVDKKTPHGCWAWLGYKNKDGYAKFSLKQHQISAARFSWETHNRKKLAKGVCVLFVCENRGCVNPEHIAVGSKKDWGILKAFRSISDVDRFWTHVNKKTKPECWEWTASLRNNYGQFHLGGKPETAHRYSWMIHYGEIPAGEMRGTMCVLHHCDNTICVNPNHLFLGNQKDNVLDMHMKGRNANVIGTNNPMCRISDSTIREIRARYAFGSETHQQIGDDMRISKTHVGQIIRHDRRQ